MHAFDKRLVECEDKWVAFQKDKDSSYAYGFIYIDEQAGLTLNYEGSFKISAEGAFLPKKLDSTNLKVRLEPNNVLVAVLPESKFKELQINALPDWLKFYKTDTNSAARLYRWGFLYNGWNECGKALTFLESALKLDPDYKGLAVEVGFSYNCLGQYHTEITVLQNALTTRPQDAYINKELLFARIKSDRLDSASECCRRVLTICTDQECNGEMCYNLLHAFFKKKDKDNFNLWIKDAKKWTVGNEKLSKTIREMEGESTNSNFIY